VELTVAVSKSQVRKPPQISGSQLGPIAQCFLQADELLVVREQKNGEAERGVGTKSKCKS
jgi:hypothetical protein